MSDEHLRPYRVEFQAVGATGWTLLSSHDRHEDALAEARKAVRKYDRDGRARVIVQHVIERV